MVFSLKEWEVWGAADSNEQKEVPGDPDEMLCLRSNLSETVLFILDIDT